ncbi:MAG TPA: Si-specific NAD(P)(+) transhydrogenase [Steroidobacteraceae bacterium]|nr:Si-specific NAD(P)(+) transhydrogenase [Steroidobacteraceae bacterium]
MNGIESFDLLVIGSGPAGQKAAVQAAKAGRRVAIIERQREVGGACVHSGTIPSKALREKALQLTRVRQIGNAFQLGLTADVPFAVLLDGVSEIVAAHDRYMAAQLERNGIRCFRGRASFKSPTVLDVLRIDGSHFDVRGERILIASGSRPRQPPDMTVDHENILDSDSILALAYLPRSLAVIGAGVIASEYASMFAALGCEVTQIDRAERPLGFLDPELSGRYLQSFTAAGGRFLAGRSVRAAGWDGVAQLDIALDDGTSLRADKMLIAQGRIANVEGLGLDAIGVKLSARGLIEVNDELCTTVRGIYAAGDVIGPPALASAAMEQGRRAACHALGLFAGAGQDSVPAGIYTIPEIATVGLDEAEARGKFGGALVGRSQFKEIARGQIAGAQDGMLKLVSDAGGRTLLGVQVVGDGATELVHVGQMALATDATIDRFVDNVFNFPTLAEAYRVAALDIVRQRPARSSLPAITDKGDRFILR